MTTLADIASAIEAVAPLSLQEKWDSSGWQILPQCTPDAACTGVLTCLDARPEVIAEAVSRGCNLVVSHHPLLFGGVKALTGATWQQRSVMEAVRAGVAVYSCHTPIDKAPHAGISWELGRRLGLAGMEVLVADAERPEAGLGVVGDLPRELTAEEAAQLVKEAYPARSVTLTGVGRGGRIRRVALSSGSCAEFVPQALARGAQMYVTSDVKYHTFLDEGSSLVLADVCHYDSEICAKSIFCEVITKKFPTFAVHPAQCEHSPVTTL